MSVPDQRIKIQNLCFPDSEICSVSALYYHETADELFLDGWYNLIYLCKWKEYTSGTGLYLQLKLTPALLQCYEGMRVYSDRKVIKEIQLQTQVSVGSKTIRSGDTNYSGYELPYQDIKGRVLFVSLVKRKDLADHFETESKQNQARPIIQGYFCLSVPENRLHAVNIGIDICTFQREAYIARNLDCLSRHLLKSAEEEAGHHIRVYLVDNGRTLDQDAAVQNISAELGAQLKIFPNKNTGGAGGFTRGMIEILKDNRRAETRKDQGLTSETDRTLTHVLLMDDDAVIDPESIVRIYGLLCCRREKWRDVSVGGAMLLEDHQDTLYSAGEYWWGSGIVSCTKLNWDLRSYEKASDPFLTETGKERKLYSGWWLCCYSLNAIREDNLPLPLFLHNDDIEYCRRNRKNGMIFLNGVGVWHHCVDLGFPGTNLYYDVRNNLIEYTIHSNRRSNILPVTSFVLKMLAGATFKFNFAGADMVYRGLLDFLKGPEFLEVTDPERLCRAVSKRSLKLKPIQELRKEDHSNRLASLEEEIQSSERTYRREGPKGLERRRKPPSVLQLVTMNGFILQSKIEPGLFLSCDAPWQNYRRKQVLIYQPSRGLAAWSTRNGYETWHMFELMSRAALCILNRYPRAARNWRQNYRKLTVQSAWEQYLGIQEES